MPIFFARKPVPRAYWPVHLSCLLTFAWPQFLGAQTASVPISEGTIVAGQSFNVEVTLQAVVHQQLRASITYTLNTPEGARRAQTDPSRFRFNCIGYASPDQQKFRLECDTGIALTSGEYSTDGKINLSRDQTGDHREDAVRAPIITLIANPDGETEFPTIAGTALLLTDRQSLADGAIRAQDILNSLTRQLPTPPRNTPAYRAYLRQEAEAARTDVDLTRRRYIAALTPANPPPDWHNNSPLPIFFEDFDRRLKKVIQDLGGVPSTLVEMRPNGPHLILAQMPKTSDSVTVTPGAGTLDKNLGELVKILTDMVKGWGGMSETGSSTFSWSATTMPPGAEIWYSRLDEEEKKWSSPTNLKDQTLPYAIWTFRFVWGNCSKSETPDPYLEPSIKMQVSETGCKRK